MGLWHVFYESWQMECCGTPFAVGDEVSWRLLFTDADDALGGGWHEQLTEIAGPVEDVPDEEEAGNDGDDDGAGVVRVLRDGTGLTVALGAAGEDVRPGERLRLTGLLSVETHGALWPEAGGRVRAVQILTQDYEEQPPGSRTWHPVRGAHRLRPVDRCPEWFTEEAPDARGRKAVETGVLVTLEVP